MIKVLYSINEMKLVQQLLYKYGILYLKYRYVNRAIECKKGKIIFFSHLGLACTVSLYLMYGIIILLSSNKQLKVKLTIIISFILTIIKYYRLCTKSIMKS